jgi:thiamine pyrophosphate-dependent acetolactate synthase large subunit-like protein
VNGAPSLVQSLEQLGVGLVFGLPGVHNLPIWKALSESGIRLVSVRHEQTAVYAADGYARATGRLGVGVVTTGPGAANTLGATGEAMASGSPVLVIATDIATSLRREGVYGGTLHETRDQTAMFAPVTKAARILASAEEIPAAVVEAGCSALAAPSGPVYLGVPTDLLSRQASVEGAASARPRQRGWSTLGRDRRGVGDRDRLRRHDDAELADPGPPTLVSINVDEVEASKNYRSDLTLVGDARAVLERLVPRVPSRGAVDELARRLAAIGADVSASVRADDEHVADFLRIVHRALPPETVVVTDMCIPGYWLAGYWQPPQPRKLAYPLGWGTLGFGFPASLGAALAGVGPTVCVCGDGGFMYACGELATAVQERIPLTIVLVDDGGYGMLRFDQVQNGETPFGVDLVTPDFVALAAAFGVPGVTVEGFGAEFERALRDSIAGERPRMIVVRASLKPPPTTSPRWYRKR